MVRAGVRLARIFAAMKPFGPTGLKGDFTQEKPAPICRVNGVNKVPRAQGVTILDDGTIPDRQQGKISPSIDEARPSAKTTT